MAFDLSAWWLKINYFTVSNRNQLKKWWVILLLAADVFIVVFVFTNLVLFLLGLSRQQQVVSALVSSPINYSQIRQQTAPSSLVVSDNLAFSVGQDKYDLLTKIENNNKNWAVSGLGYKYDLAGQQTESFTEFIHPQSTKYLSALGVSVASNRVSEISFSFKEIEWQWVDYPDQLTDFKFNISDMEYTASPLPSGQNIGQVAAKVENVSLVGFWKTRFIVLLYNRNKVVGVEYAYFDQFRLNEKRNLLVQWSEINSPVSSVEIMPDFNFLDNENIIKS